MNFSKPTGPDCNEFRLMHPVVHQRGLFVATVIGLLMLLPACGGNQDQPRSAVVTPPATVARQAAAEPTDPGEQSEYLLRATVSPQQSGTIRLAPEAEERRYPTGATVVVTVSCNTEFVTWTGDVEAGTAGSNPVTVTMDRDRSLRATCAVLTPTPTPTSPRAVPNPVPTPVPTAITPTTVQRQPVAAGPPTPTRRPTATPRPTPTPMSTPTPTPRPTPTMVPIPFDGVYTLVVDQGAGSFVGKTVSFKVGNLDARETAIWEQGGTTGLDFTAFSGRNRCSKDAGGECNGDTSKGGLLAAPMAQRVPPHMFTGTAEVDGAPASAGTTVSAWISGELVAESLVTARRVPDAATRTARLFRSLDNNLNVVWRFNIQIEAWEFYSPYLIFSKVNTYTDATRGDIVWVDVGDHQLFQGQDLFAGWNLIAIN